jgi:hypothetical protein
MDKKKFVLRMDDDLYKAIERWASDEFRSVNGQIEWMLHQMLKDAGRLKKNLTANDSKKTQKE